MSADWTQYAKAKDLELDEGAVVVRFGDGRHQRVTCQDEEDGWRIRTIVARAAALAAVDGVHLRAWRQNRVATLVGFRIDERGRLVGEAWVPKAGITSEEFRVYLRTVAAQSDHLEKVLTGVDAE